MRARLLLAVPALALLSLPAAAAPRPGFGWPLPGTPTVERSFAPPAQAYGPGHRGVDLRASLGQRVLAAGPGQVTYSGLLAGRGVVTVSHAGGLRTTYEPLEPAVKVGDLVFRGSVLGRLSVGHTSCRRLTCLHWGLLRGQAYLNPLSLVAGGPMRLLPLTGTGSALTGSAHVQPHVRTLAAPQVRPSGGRSGAIAASAATGAGALAGAALLGWTALRRQDARGRSPRRVPQTSRGP